MTEVALTTDMSPGEMYSAMRGATKVTIRDPSSSPRFPGVWTHSKGGEYRIIGFGIIEETMEPSVIYENTTSGHVWIRPCVKFFDGRFKPEIK